mmetsp:Transcript_21595/g.50398  ORF Transcript_21595/g.50398 Transcript_21595/m.50398 type:complete len:83 (-) Transcript_21595:14-262(-)
MCSSPGGGVLAARSGDVWANMLWIADGLHCEGDMPWNPGGALSGSSSSTRLGELVMCATQRQSLPPHRAGYLKHSPSYLSIS